MILSAASKAYGISCGGDSMLEDFITFEMLRSFPGMVAVTWSITQYFKHSALFKKLRTRFFTLLVAELLLFSLGWSDGTLSLSNFPITLLNGFIVALAAMKGHESIVERGRGKPA